MCSYFCSYLKNRFSAVVVVTVVVWSWQVVAASAFMVAWSQSFALVVVTCLAWIHLSYSVELCEPVNTT